MAENKLVSIIVPCYNAEKFITAMISSVLEQTYPYFEIIVIDDGSTDRSSDYISSFKDPRISYLKKNNTGVSDSRNKGLEKATGEYVLFLDADDILSPDFLEKRVQFLEEHPYHGFCFSSVIKIDEEGLEIPGNKIDGAGIDPLSEILTYDLHFVTCPSNYVFRKKILTTHQLQFNPELSSSADRFFLIEVSRFTTGGRIEGAYLFYRVHRNSMSNSLTLNLLRDNIRFQKKVLKLQYIPNSLRKVFCYKTNYIFAGSYYKLKKFIPLTLFSIKAFYFNPIGFSKKIARNCLDLFQSG